MSASTPRLTLAELPEGQAMNAAEINAVLGQLDALVDCCLKGVFVDAAPMGASDGDTYLVGGSPSGDWGAEFTYKLAYRRDGAWDPPVEPFNGLRAFVPDTGRLLIYNDGVWTDWTSLISAQEAAIASAATCDIGAADALVLQITGTTAISSLGITANRLRLVRFADALTLMHNAGSLILPGAADIVTAAGDTAIVTSDGSGNWRCRHYSRASGQPLNGNLSCPALTTMTASNTSNWDPVSAHSGAPSCLAVGTFGGGYVLSDTNFIGLWSSASGGVLNFGFGAAVNNMAPKASITSGGVVAATALAIANTPGGTNGVDITQNQNGSSVASISNNSGGSSATAAFRATNTGNDALFGVTGGSFATAGVIAGLDAFILNTVSGGIALATASNIKFGTASSEFGRFGADGSFLVGTTTNSGWNGGGRLVTQANGGNYAFSSYQASASGGSILNRVDNTASPFMLLNFGSGTVVGSITTDGTAATYGTTSDERLKNWSVEQMDYRAAIKSLWVGDFEWKASGTRAFGVLAQQAYDVMPYGMGVSRPANDADQWHASSEPFGHLALWGVKDLYAMVEALAARVTALEAAHDAG